MGIRTLTGFALCVFALGAFGTATAVVPGDAAPDFTLLDVSGNSHRLSDYRGRVVLLALVGYG